MVCVFLALPLSPQAHIFLRLLEYAQTYFDLSSFPDGETKRALQKVVNKRAGKANRDGADDTRAKKKQKKIK